MIINLGNAGVLGSEGDPVVITDKLPAGVVALGHMSAEADTGADGQLRPKLKCSELPELRCTWSGKVPSFISLEASIPVEAQHAGALGNNEMTVSGAKTAEGEIVPEQTDTHALEGSVEPTPFGVESYELKAEEEDGSADLQAGSHPFQLTTTLEFNQVFSHNTRQNKEQPGTPALLKNVDTTLPVGLVAATVGVPQCSDADFQAVRPGSSDECPADTAIGAVAVTFKEPIYETRTETVPLFNLVPARGEPARIGFEFDEVPVALDTSIKTGDGYAAEVDARYTSELAEVMGTIVTVWGVPADERHKGARGWDCLGEGHFVEELAGKLGIPMPCEGLGDAHPPAAYLNMPTTCGQPLLTSVQAQSWVSGARPEPQPALQAANPQTLEGCGKLAFSSAIDVKPDQPQASTPSGLDVKIEVPQNTTLEAGPLDRDEADIKETTMTLPLGLQVSPASAGGLGTCGVGETGFDGLGGDSGATLEDELAAQQFTPEGVSCPNASKLGEVTIDSPLLEHELNGYMYVGEQDTNPFASPLVLYLIAEDPVSGVLVKLAGEVRIAADGQITTVFKNTPPLPFDSLDAAPVQRSRASQTTPAFCRNYESTASFALWSSGSPAHASAASRRQSGPNGTPCQTQGPLPFAPSQTAGVSNNQAGAFSPFTLTINRPDGNQALNTITTQLPPGAAAQIAKVTPCPEPQAAEWQLRRRKPDRVLDDQRRPRRRAVLAARQGVSHRPLRRRAVRPVLGHRSEGGRVRSRHGGRALEHQRQPVHGGGEHRHRGVAVLRIASGYGRTEQLRGAAGTDRGHARPDQTADGDDRPRRIRVQPDELRADGGDRHADRL